MFKSTHVDEADLMSGRNADPRTGALTDIVQSTIDEMVMDT